MSTLQLNLKTVFSLLACMFFYDDLPDSIDTLLHNSSNKLIVLSVRSDWLVGGDTTLLFTRSRAGGPRF